MRETARTDDRTWPSKLRTDSQTRVRRTPTSQSMIRANRMRARDRRCRCRWRRRPAATELPGRQERRRPANSRTELRESRLDSCRALDQGGGQERKHDLMMAGDRIAAATGTRVRTFDDIHARAIVLQKIEVDGGEAGESMTEVAHG